MKFERAILFNALLSSLSGTVIALIFVWPGDHSTNSQVSLTLLMVITWFGFAFATRSKAVFPLRTLTNLLEALRERDFSMRVRGASHDDAMGELIYEVNSLTPIQSVAQSLQLSLKQSKHDTTWEEDLHEGLEIIAERSEILSHFIVSYFQLTRLPDPNYEAMEVTGWIHHVTALETRLEVDFIARLCAFVTCFVRRRIHFFEFHRQSCGSTV